MLSEADSSGISRLEEESETAAALGEILACLGETPELITIGATPAPAETGSYPFSLSRNSSGVKRYSWVP